MVVKKNGKSKTEKKPPETVVGSLARPEVSELIGQRLRRFYDEIATQAVPDRFIDLLEKLEAATPPNTPSKKDR